MNIDQGKKYHGYLAFPRHAKMIQKDLDFHLFSFHTALVMEARWFRGNPHFCHVVGTQAEIAEEIGTSQSSLSRGLDGLHDKGYVLKHKSYIILKYFPLFLPDVAEKIHSKNYSNLHELYADVYRINAEMQEKYALSQAKRGQNVTQSLYSSSNDNLSSSQEDIDLDEIAEGIEKQKEKKESSL